MITEKRKTKKRNLPIKVTIVGLLVLWCSAVNLIAEEKSFARIKGHWEGAATTDIGQFSLVVDFTADGTLQATLSFPDNNIGFIRAENVSFEPPRVHFELPESGGSVRIFEGILDKKVLSGTFVKGDSAGGFMLKRLSAKPRTGAMYIGEQDDARLKAFTDVHNGEVLVDIPKSFELFNIAVAITDHGLNSPYLFNKNSRYYQEVLQHFLPFKEHPLISKIEFSDAKLLDYLNLRNNSLFYDYKKGHLTKKDFLPPYSTSLFNKDMKLLFESFAKKTHFEAFYRQHESYYRQQITSYDLQVPVKKMWRWLEDQFPNKYSTYMVVFSPLIGGTHNTIRLGSEGYRLCVMFVSGPETGNGQDDPLTEARLSRIVFTEIDHNYVNPTTDLYSREVDEALSDLATWHDFKKQANAYGSPYVVINEYLTWVVFLLYASDNYEHATFKTIEKLVNQQMEVDRGFLRFSSFSAFCLELYGNKGKDRKVSDLFPEMIQWFRDYRE